MAETRTIEAEPSPPESLFHQLFRNRSQDEVNVSKAFAVCFRESPPFAQTVVRLLSKTCQIPPPSFKLKWECYTEVASPKGRPDIEIHAPGGPFFRLESKVKARLTQEQLRRYRLQKDGEYLIAVTKRPPTVPAKWLMSKGVFAIRWQDVHRAVVASGGTGRHSYLRDSFCLYLEELGMAHRETVTVDDLKGLHELLDTVSVNGKHL
jgi:hypothetical protein